MTENTVREYVENSTRCAVNGDTSACMAADNQGGRLNIQQLREASRIMTDNGVLPQVTVVNMRRNFDLMDQDRNGAITTGEVRQVVRNQIHQPEGLRNNHLLNTAQDALRLMDREVRSAYVRADFQGADNMTPMARSHFQALQNFDSLRERMRRINPDSISDNQINVGDLNTAVQRNPGGFLPSELETARTLLQNRDRLAQSNGFFNRLHNVFNSDGMYFSRETLSERVRELGTAGIADSRTPYAAMLANPVIGTELPLPIPPIPPAQFLPQAPGSLDMQPVTSEYPRGFQPSGDPRYINYSVRRNDTLSSIARDYLTRMGGAAPTETQVYNFVNTIARESGIADANAIRPSQQLRIPANWRDGIIPGQRICR